MDAKKYNHHIIPRCMGGSDDSSNIIALTYEEHIEAHRILHEKYPEHFGLRFAYLNMINLNEQAHKEACSRGGKKSASVGGPAKGGSIGGKTSGKMTGTRNLHGWRKKNPEKSRLISASNGKLTSRKIVCVQTGIIYDSVNHAMREVNSTNIARCLNTGGATKGLNWKYYE